MPFSTSTIPDAKHLCGDLHLDCSV